MDSSDDSGEEFNPNDSPAIRFQSTSSFVNKVLPTKLEEEKPYDFEVSSNTHCSRDCIQNCELAFKSMCEKDQEHLKSAFKSSKKSQMKRILLEYLKHQELILNYKSDKFCYSGHQYCIKFFSFVTGLSFYLLKNALNDFSRGIRYYNFARKPGRHSFKTTQFLLWFKIFSEKFGQQSSKDQVIVLPSYLTRKKIYGLYKEEVPDVSQIVSFSTACSMINLKFGPRRKDRFYPWVRFSSYSSHSRCNICANLQFLKRSCRGQDEYNRLQALLYKHKEKYGKTRLWIEQETQKSVIMPDNHLTLHIDSMDNAKSNLPHPSVKTKTNSNMWKLPSKVS